LTTAASQETAHNIVQTILTKIDAICFDEDFDLPDKSAWLDRAYLQQHYGDLDLSEPARHDILNTDCVLLNSWKKQVGTVTTARNRLRAMFTQVSHLIPSLTNHLSSHLNPKYGAMVLLDPVWNLRTLQSHQGSELHKVLMALPSKLVGLRPNDPLDTPHPLTILQPSVKHALVCIVDALAGLPAAIYVNQFLDDYAPEFSIPHDPQFN
jgi:hypothetical protein